MNPEISSGFTRRGPSCGPREPSEPNEPNLYNFRKNYQWYTPRRGYRHFRVHWVHLSRKRSGGGRLRVNPVGSPRVHLGSPNTSIRDITTTPSRAAGQHHPSRHCYTILCYGCVLLRHQDDLYRVRPPRPTQPGQRPTLRHGRNWTYHVILYTQAERRAVLELVQIRAAIYWQGCQTVTPDGRWSQYTSPSVRHINMVSLWFDDPS